VKSVIDINNYFVSIQLITSLVWNKTKFKICGMSRTSLQHKHLIVMI